LKSLDAESRSYDSHANIIEDKTFRKHSSDSNISSSAVFVQPKARVPNRSTSHGLMVGNQSEGLTGLKSSTMQVNSGNITQTSFGFPKLMTPWKQPSMNLALLIWRMRNFLFFSQISLPTSMMSSMDLWT
jgi:hypothetical protein